LLLFEKVRKGTVLAHVEETEVMPFLLQSFKARSAIGVSVCFLSPDRGNPEELAGVAVDIDKKLLGTHILKLFNRCWSGGSDKDKIVSAPLKRMSYSQRRRTYVPRRVDQEHVTAPDDLGEASGSVQS
jgi:hypothetical protein